LALPRNKREDKKEHEPRNKGGEKKRARYGRRKVHKEGENF